MRVFLEKSVFLKAKQQQHMRVRLGKPYVAGKGHPNAIWLQQPVRYAGEKLDKREWMVEPKIDGWRLQIRSDSNGKIEYRGRHIDKQSPWNLKVPLQLPPDTIVDAELVAEDGRGNIYSAIKGVVKPIIYVFDVVYLGGKFLGNLPLLERKKILNKLDWQPPFNVVNGEELKDANAQLKEALDNGFEGIVLKKKDSHYTPGVKGPGRSRDWRKLKVRIGGKQ